MSEPTKGPWELQEYPGERFAEVWSRSQEKAIAKVWFGGYLDDSLNRLCVEEEAANAELIVNALNWKSHAEKAEAENAKLHADLQEAQDRCGVLDSDRRRLQARVQELEGELTLCRQAWQNSIGAEAQREHENIALEAQLKQAGEDSRMLDWLSDKLAYIMLSGPPMFTLPNKGKGWQGNELRDAIRASMDQAKQEGQ